MGFKYDVTQQPGIVILGRKGNLMPRSALDKYLLHARILGELLTIHAGKHAALIGKKAHANMLCPEAPFRNGVLSTFGEVQSQSDSIKTAAFPYQGR